MKNEVEEVNTAVSAEERGVAVKKKMTMKEVFFGDINWQAVGKTLTKEVSFEGFKRVMTSDVDFGAIKNALLAPVPDKNIDVIGGIKKFCSIKINI